MTGQRILWTPHAAAYLLLGLVLLPLGSWLGSTPLVTWGGLLLLLVAWDALRLQARPPRVTLHVESRRVPEGSKLRVRLEGDGLHADHELHVPLSPGLLLGEGSNLWHPGPQREGRHGFLLEAAVRGPQRVGPATVRNWSPARLWARDQAVTPEHTVEVVPRMEDVAQVGIRSKVVKPMQGRFTVNRPGQGFDFFTLRQYTPGDTMRSVNWKASARREEDLIVNQRQMETHSELLLLLDARVVSGVGPLGQTPLDRGCRVALGLFADAVAGRDTVRFLAYGDGLTALPPGRSDRVTALETVLARLGAAGTVPLAAAWGEARGALRSKGPILLLSSAEADAGLAEAVGDMAGRGHPVTVLSPRPADAAWESDTQRRQARAAALDAARDRGAVVVDWAPGTPLLAHSPVVTGVLP